jgi:hypothetical protein
MSILKQIRDLKREAFHRFEGPRIIRRNFRAFYGRDFPAVPATLTEKITHRMIALHDSGDPLMTRLADKILVRDYVRERIGAEHLADLLWQGTDPAEIPFDELPAKCILKTNHGSGMNQVLDASVDRREVIRVFRKWLKVNFYYGQRELHYKNIEPRLLIERFIEDEYPGGPLLFNFWCFNGKTEFILLGYDGLVLPFFDSDWKPLPYSYRRLKSPNPMDGRILRPKNFEKMVEIASALSHGMPFVRIDLYNADGHVIFGEMTFTPKAGFFHMVPPEWDAILGAKWEMATGHL